MSTKVAINGFGRIGRLALRAMLERHKQELTVVAVNDMADLQTNAHLFRYDSTYGMFPGQIETGEGGLKDRRLGDQGTQSKRSLAAAVASTGRRYRY
jgi:glyceraldehyde-3-phosphate dehydrogenase/erythrose-4-phosphate dehydrogenase